MNLDLLLERFVGAWGWALLNFLWQGVVIGLVAALLLAVLRGAPARWRYAVCALGLALCLVATTRHGVGIGAQSPCFAEAWAQALTAPGPLEKLVTGGT